MARALSDTLTDVADRVAGALADAADPHHQRPCRRLSQHRLLPYPHLRRRPRPLADILDRVARARAKLFNGSPQAFDQLRVAV